MFEEMAGLERAYGRTFVSDVAHGEDLATPAADVDELWQMTAMVLQFDRPANAASGYRAMVDEATMVTTDSEYDRVELDLELKHTALLVEEGTDGAPASTLVAFVQDGEYVSVVIAVAVGTDAMEHATGIVRVIVESDTGTFPEMFNPDGGSTGGLWEKLPSVEDEGKLLQGLEPYGDSIFYPAEAGTPGA